MQENHLNTIVDKAFLGHIQKPKKVKSQMKVLAAKNKADLKDLPDYERVPDAHELTEMRQYGVDYKKNNKKASRREVRRAIQEKFNIRIYK